LSVARDDNRPTSVRRAALTHLAMEVNRHLGIDDASAETDDDEMRKEAVFVLSQHSHSENTPALMEVARSAKHPAVRRDAIFWLGQTGDVRAVADLYAELLEEK
jgi:HEAT repeat protein